MGRAGSALVVGTGVIGHATGALFARAGFEVAGFDPDSNALAGFAGELLATETPRREWDIIALCVPTPTVDGAMSAGALRDAVAFVRTLVAGGQGFTLVAVRSTIVPGTMDEVVAPLLAAEAAEGRVGLCHWPSFARERSAAEDELHPRATLFGTDAREPTLAALSRLAERLGPPVRFMSFAESELVKHGANLFNALKISYFNAVGDWAAERGGDAAAVAETIRTVAEGAWNPAYGITPGPAFGGACLPKDLAALAARLGSDGSPHLDLLHAIAAINAAPTRH